jgi:hypothetical protein
MKYKYPPIYKYGFLLLVLCMFFKHQQIMSQDKVLTNSIIIVIIFMACDYIIIKNHPHLFNNKIMIQKQQRSTIDNDDLSIEDDIQSLELDSY